MTQLYFHLDEKWVPIAPEKETILQASLKAGIGHTHVCGGRARCSTCRVMILQGLDQCNPRNPREQLLADKLHFSANIRLACQTTVKDSIKLRRLVRDQADLALANQLSGQGLGAVGVEQSVVILFSDLKGFTAFAEAVTAYDALHILNRHFQQLEEIVNRQGGYISNYTGDGVLALFEVKGTRPPVMPIRQAVRAGLEIIASLAKLNEYLKELYELKLDIRVGMHYGEAIVGELGAASSKRLSAIGDAVNLASRIEQANKGVNTRLLVSQAVYEQIKSYFEVGQQFEVRLAGKSGTYLLSEIVAEHNSG